MPFFLSMQNVGHEHHSRTSLFWTMCQEEREAHCYSRNRAWYHSMDHLLVGEETLCPNRHVIPVALLSFTKITLYAVSSFHGFGFVEQLTFTFHAEKYCTAML